MVAGYLLSEANTLVMLLVSSSLWLAQLQKELAPKQLDEIKVAELDKAVSLKLKPGWKVYIRFSRMRQ